MVNSIGGSRNKISVVWWSIAFVLLFNAVFLFGGRFRGVMQPMDDHEIFAIPAQIQSSSLPATLLRWTGDDLGLRFRPVYAFYRVISCAMFGGNISAAAITAIVLGNIFGLGLLWCFAYFRYPAVLAFFLAFSCCFGPQIECWFLVGCQENIALILMLLVLFQIFRVAGKSNAFGEIILFFFIALLTLAKEPFILTIPALLVFRYILESEKASSAKWHELLLRRKWQYVLPIVLCIFEILIIKIVIRPHYTIAENGKMIYGLPFNVLYSGLVGYGELLFSVFIILWVAVSRLRKRLLPIALLVISGAGAQVAGYPLIYQRYMLPCVFFYALGICELLKILLDEKFSVDECKKLKRIGVVSAALLIIAAVVFLVTLNLKIAKGKTFDEFVPVSIASVAAGMIILSAIILNAGRLWKYKALLVSLPLAFLAVRGNWQLSVREIALRAKGCMAIEELKNRLLSLDKGKVILFVSDPADGIAWEHQVTLLSYLDYQKKYPVRWCLYNISDSGLDSLVHQGWRGFHQGEMLVRKIIRTLPRDLNPQAAVVIDRRNCGLVETVCRAYPELTRSKHYGAATLYMLKK